ncbi:MAG: tRNA uridine-5-carboxymethylaminomethyl(34) synthesis GTPase MnmE [Kiritimatiellae bacterium]|nr:tRNA uridine-5-carboxymethylaminomethyl(34) synthesis GTPase MnmE [Kiritimatiellia bacterium]
MTDDERDRPIAAVATPPGLGGICIVRISGEGALAIGDKLIPDRIPRVSERPANTFFHAPVLHPVTREKIDDALFLIFRAPRSYTGEETLEIQGHGGGCVSRRLLEAVLDAGARLARPGEFSQRAFLNGRMDLTQAEAVCDLIHARSERAARQARLQLDGLLGRQIDAVYDRLLTVSADVEHLLDFDEGELPDTFLEDAARRLDGPLETVRALIRTRHEGQLIRDGALVVISGRPNAGKSSLMNALLRQNRAIVHARPGTTRDVIEESCVLEGIPLRLVDTAGLRETEDEIEREGILRARAWMEQADLNLHLVDRSDSHSLETLPALPDPAKTILVLTKCDLPARLPEPLPLPERPAATVTISTLTGENLSTLQTAIRDLLGLDPGPEETVHATVSLRHAEELQTVLGEGLAGKAELARGPEGMVLAALHLKNACEALGRITGRVYSDDLLDRIFSRFCVGK